jgi:RNA polymerase sigma-70 factor (ECF subfamily)
MSKSDFACFRGTLHASAAVIPFPAEGDRALVTAIAQKRPGAEALLFDRYGKLVENVLWRTLGPDLEIEDVLHDVFVTAFASLESLREPDAVRGWLIGIAIRQARKRIRKRRRGNFIRLFAPNKLPERVSDAAPAEVTRALRACYEILDRLPVDLRLVFTLRYFEGLELTEVADACGVSLATAKRHLTRAQERFSAHAAKSAALADWFGRSP